MQMSTVALLNQSPGDGRNRLRNSQITDHLVEFFVRHILKLAAPSRKNTRHPFFFGSY